MKLILMIGFGGFLGSILRYYSGVLAIKMFSSSFPYSTFFVNIIGCFLIGICVTFISKQSAYHKELEWMFVIGFLGSYTTFSTFANENLKLLFNGEHFTFFAYVLLSIIVGIVAVYLGYLLTNALYGLVKS